MITTTGTARSHNGKDNHLLVSWQLLSGNGSMLTQCLPSCSYTHPLSNAMQCHPHLESPQREQLAFMHLPPTTIPAKLLIRNDSYTNQCSTIPAAQCIPLLTWRALKQHCSRPVGLELAPCASSNSIVHLGVEQGKEDGVLDFPGREELGGEKGRGRGRETRRFKVKNLRIALIWFIVHLGVEQGKEDGVLNLPGRGFRV